MKIKLSYLSIAVFIAGCHLEKPFYQPLSVKAKSGDLCFTVPIENYPRKILKISEPYISWRDEQQWKKVELPADIASEQEVAAGQCIVWQGVNWLPGEYDIAVKVRDNTNEQVRYAAHFTLIKYKDDEIILKHIKN